MELPRSLWWSRLVLLFVMLLTAVRPFPSGARSATDEVARAITPPQHGTDCPSLVGNPDLYGLGIRLGIYFQMIASLLANHYYPEKLKEALGTNIVFVAAVLLAILRATAIDQLRPVEGFVMLQLLLCFQLSVIVPTTSYIWAFAYLANVYAAMRLPKDFKLIAHIQAENARLSTLLRKLLQITIASFQLYFWFGLVKDSNECDQYIFLFTKVLLSPPVIQFFQGLSIIYEVFVLSTFWLIHVPVIGWCIRTVVSAVLRVRSLDGFGNDLVKGYIFMSFAVDEFENIHLEDDQVERLRDMREWRYARDANHILGYARVFGMTYGSIIILWSILTAELTLWFNSVSYVYSLGTTGQLIPFVIGTTGLLRTFHGILVRALRARQEYQTARQNISVAKSTGVFRYCLRDGRIAQFDGFAEGRERRRSADASDLRIYPRRTSLPFSKNGIVDPIPPPQFLAPRFDMFLEPRPFFERNAGLDFYTQLGRDTDSDSDATSVSSLGDNRSDWSMLSRLTDSSDYTASHAASNDYQPQNCIYRGRGRNLRCEIEFYSLRNGQGQLFVRHNLSRFGRSASTGDIPISRLQPRRIAPEKLHMIRTPEARRDMKYRYWQRDRERWKNIRNARKRYKFAHMIPGTQRWSYTHESGRNLELIYHTPRRLAGWRRGSWNGRDSTPLRRTRCGSLHEATDIDVHSPGNAPISRPSRWARFKERWRLDEQLIEGGEPDFRYLSLLGRTLFHASWEIATGLREQYSRRHSESKMRALLLFSVYGLLAIPVALMALFWLPLEAALWGDLEGNPKKDNHGPGGSNGPIREEQ